MIEAARRLVTRLPLTELWTTSANLVTARCVGTLSKEALSQLLKEGPVLFVVADVGHRPIWISIDECYSFWKEEVKPHLADADGGIVLESFPGHYAYIARQWTADLPHPVVVLEKLH
jgi:hypothetical protein